jgi:Putative TM nitroreductase
MVVTEIIKKRFSCRTYSERSLEDKVMQEFLTIVNDTHKGPFGNQPNFRLIHLPSFTIQEGKKLGTYGVIKNARLFLVGTIKNGHLAMEDYGYCKEEIILKATALGLGTCWLGGTFQSSNFARAVDLQKDELLPTVTPIGYPALEKSFTERIMRLVAGSDNRKPWSDIFFAEYFPTPLTQKQAGIYAEALENVRLAPSASNKQPWRVLYDAKLNIFHFFIARAFSYKLMGKVSLQDIDLGIAMSHFALTLQELGIKGKWQIASNAPKEKSLDYIVSWQGEN